MRSTHSHHSEEGLIKLHWLIVAAMVLLISLGLIYIYSASSIKGAELVGKPEYFFIKQSFTASLVFLFTFILLYSPGQVIDRLPLPLLLISLVLLSSVLVPGLYSTVGGAKRWINLAGLRFQPSELAKLAFVFFLAKNLSRPKSNINQIYSGLIPNLAVCLFFCFFLFLQKDYGSIVIILSLLTIMLFASGLKLKYLLYSALGIASALVTLIIIEPYRVKRLLVYLDPWKHQSTGGFQIIQSYLAFQNGGIFGLGVGNSQQKLHFLPEAHTDFILSVIAEESGMIGLFLLLFLYIFIILSGFYIVDRHINSYKKFLALGLTSLLACQTLLNLGVVTGLLPTKGLTLPFVSSGSSSLLCFGVLGALLAKLAKELDPPKKVNSTSH